MQSGFTLRDERRTGEQILGSSVPKVLIQHVGQTRDTLLEDSLVSRYPFEAPCRRAGGSVPLQRNTATPSDDRSKAPTKDQCFHPTACETVTKPEAAVCGRRSPPAFLEATCGLLFARGSGTPSFGPDEKRCRLATKVRLEGTRRA